MAKLIRRNRRKLTDVTVSESQTVANLRAQIIALQELIAELQRPAENYFIYPSETSYPSNTTYPRGE